MPSGDLLCVLFNLGLDPIEKTELVFDRKISEIEKLLPDGTKSKVAFASTDGRCILDTSCDTLNPLVLFVR